MQNDLLDILIKSGMTQKEALEFINEMINDNKFMQDLKLLYNNMCDYNSLCPECLNQIDYIVSEEPRGEAFGYPVYEHVYQIFCRVCGWKGE